MHDTQTAVTQTKHPTTNASSFQPISTRVALWGFSMLVTPSSKQPTTKSYKPLVHKVLFKL
jgi:hypothetical protein